MSKKEYTFEVKKRYQTGNKEEKSNILNEFCKVTGCHRKSGIRRLNASKKEELKKRVCRESRGRKSKYRDPEFIEALKALWLETNQLCAVNFKPAIPEWIKAFEEVYPISEEIKGKLLKISVATIGRVLQPSKYRTKRKGTTPGTMLRTQIPIRTNFWDVNKPGYMEADTVAHCGGSLSGEFVWSLTVTDINTTWTEQRALWHKYATEVRDAIEDVQKCLPFKLIGLDTDNGSEFINYALVHYLAGKFIEFTRSREYKKNDNAYVEQKNWTHARGLLGYERIDAQEVVPLLNDLLRNEVSLFNNHFIPCLKLESKERRASKIFRKYDDPKTPYQRVLLSPHIAQDVKDKLQKVHETLNPITLRKTINLKLRAIFKIVHTRRISAGLIASENSATV